MLRLRIVFDKAEVSTQTFRTLHSGPEINRADAKKATARKEEWIDTNQNFCRERLLEAKRMTDYQALPMAFFKTFLTRG